MVAGAPGTIFCGKEEGVTEMVVWKEISQTTSAWKVETNSAFWWEQLKIQI